MSQSEKLSDLVSSIEEVAIGSIKTVEACEAKMAEVLEMWKDCEEGSASYKAEAALYAKLMIKKKELLGSLGSKPNATPSDVLHHFNAAKAMLHMNVEEIDAIVKAHGGQTLAEVLYVAYAVRRHMLLSQYQEILTVESLTMFMALVDQKIEAKIKARTEGQHAAVYEAAFVAAKAKYLDGASGAGQGVPLPPVAAEATPSKPTPPVKKPKPKALSKPPVPPGPSDPAPPAGLGQLGTEPIASGPFSWIDVQDLLVKIPANPHTQAMKGLPVRWVSPRIWDLMQAEVETERMMWQAAGLECSDLLIRHNYVSSLLDGLTVHHVGEESKIQQTTKGPAVVKVYETSQIALALMTGPEGLLGVGLMLQHEKEQSLGVMPS